MSEIRVAASRKAMWDFLALSGGEVLGKIAGFLSFAFLARMLTPGNFGAVELSISLLTLFISIVEFGFGPIGAREIARKPGEADRLAGLIPAARVVLVLASYPVAVVLIMSLSYSAETRMLLYVTLLSLFTVPFNQQWLLQGLEKMSLVSLAQAVHMFVFMLGVFALVDSDSPLYLVGIIEILASCTMVLYLAMQQRRMGFKIRLRFEKPALKSLFKEAYPVGLGKIVWTANHTVPSLLLVSFSTLVELAWFAAAFRIVNALLSFSLVYHFNLYPSVVRRLQSSVKAYKELYLPSYRLCAWAGVGVALTISILAAVLCEIAYGAEFKRAALPLTVLVWIVPITLLSSHARWALIAANLQVLVLRSQIFGLIVCAVSGTFLIPEYGSLGGSFCILLSGLTVWAYSHIKACQKVTYLPFSTVLLPAVFAGVMLWINAVYVESSVIHSLMQVMLFFLVAPLLDRQLIPSIFSIIAIKNDV